MATQIELKPILPQEGNWNVFEQAIARTLNEILEVYERDLTRYVGTWNHKPKWKKEIKKRRASYVGKIGTDNRQFAWVEEGTKSYWPIMSRNFVSKTAPGRLVSGPGSGGKAGFRRRPKRPGIKGRKNLPLIAKLRENRFGVIATINMNVAASNLFGGRGFISFRVI